MPHATQHEAQAFRLTYLDRFKIRDKSVGFTEPSGLALSRDEQAPWTISDDTPKIFQLSLDGNLKPDLSLYKTQDWKASTWTPLAIRSLWSRKKPTRSSR